MQLAGRASFITSQSFHFENAVESCVLGTISAAPFLSLQNFFAGFHKHRSE
jgi:hypothetical protein